MPVINTSVVVTTTTTTTTTEIATERTKERVTVEGKIHKIKGREGREKNYLENDHIEALAKRENLQKQLMETTNIEEFKRCMEETYREGTRKDILPTEKEIKEANIIIISFCLILAATLWQVPQSRTAMCIKALTETLLQEELEMEEIEGEEGGGMKQKKVVTFPQKLGPCTKNTETNRVGTSREYTSDCKCKYTKRELKVLGNVYVKYIQLIREIAPTTQIVQVGMMLKTNLPEEDPNFAVVWHPTYFACKCIFPKQKWVEYSAAVVAKKKLPLFARDIQEEQRQIGVALGQKWGHECGMRFGSQCGTRYGPINGELYGKANLLKYTNDQINIRMEANQCSREEAKQMYYHEKGKISASNAIRNSNGLFVKKDYVMEDDQVALERQEAIERGNEWQDVPRNTIFDSKDYQKTLHRFKHILRRVQKVVKTGRKSSTKKAKRAVTKIGMFFSVFDQCQFTLGVPGKNMELKLGPYVKDEFVHFEKDFSSNVVRVLYNKEVCASFRPLSNLNRDAESLFDEKFNQS